LADIWENWGLCEHRAQMDVYMDSGPPPFISLAAMAGFRPARGPSGENPDVCGAEDFARLLAAAPGGCRTAPPDEA
jgi:hypothetical protein